MKHCIATLLALAPLSVWAAAPSAYDAVVAADGTGDYTTVSQAIQAAPEGRTEPWLILVKKGDYDEHVEIPATKPFIHLIGQGRASTSIRFKINHGKQDMEAGRFSKSGFYGYSKNNPDGPCAGMEGATVYVGAPDFYTEGISYINDWGREAWSGPQALAFYGNADRQAFKDCAFISFQDTWRTPGAPDTRTYARDCYIEGAVDYLYGGGDLLLERSTFYNVRSGSVIVAPNHNGERWGYVIKDCVIDGNEEARDGRQKLGRPWHGHPKAVYLNTTMLIPVSAAGWDDMGAVPELFAEYNSHDCQGRPLDLSGRKSHYSTKGRKKGDTTLEGSCPVSLDSVQASRYTYEAVIRPEEGWDPRAMMAPLPAPAGLSYDGSVLSWNQVPGARGYIVLDGDRIIGTPASPRLPIGCIARAIRVRAVNAAGSPGLSSLLR